MLLYQSESNHNLLYAAVRLRHWFAPNRRHVDLRKLTGHHWLRRDTDKAAGWSYTQLNAKSETVDTGRSIMVDRKAVGPNELPDEVLTVQWNRFCPLPSLRFDLRLPYREVFSDDVFVVWVLSLFCVCVRLFPSCYLALIFVGLHFSE